MRKCIGIGGLLASIAFTVTVTGGLAQNAPAVQPPAAQPAVSAQPKPADKLVLTYKARKDLVARYRNQSVMTADFPQGKFVAASNSTVKVTVASVAANGNITFEQITETSERTFNGQRQPEEDLSKTKSSFSVAPDGTLLSMKEEDPTESKGAAREYAAEAVVFPATPVGVGDKWARDYKTDEALGTRDGHADFEVLASEMKSGVDTFKVKMEFREKSGAHPIHTISLFWVEKATGDTVFSETEIENAPGPDDNIVFKGRLHSERISGSPFDSAASAASKAEVKTIDDIVKGYEKLPGLFTLYRKKENGRETIYAEIKEDQLGKLMLLETTASTGNSSAIVAGTPIDDLLFKLQRQDEKLLLITPNINFRADEKSPISKALKRSFADGILESFRIEGKQPDRNSVLINVSDFFRGDIAQIGKALSGGSNPLAALLGGGGGAYIMDREKSYVDAVKNFPENMTIETQYHFIGGGRAALAGDPGQADPRSFPLRVTYTLFPLLDRGFKPRRSDPRIGYFTTEFQSFDNDATDDPIVRYIYRWNLQKSDPTARLSLPKKQIVFWLDNAIPTEYRDAVKEGLLAWNSAFERIGIRDAIVVRQMPDNADWDHADMRFNTIRWVASPDSSYAVSLMRVNPLTGEILNANITVDANFTRSIKAERRQLVNPAAYFELQDPLQQAAQKFDPRKCEMAQGMAEQAWFGSMAIGMLDPENRVDDKEYVRSYLRHVVTHEMGHIMGLRHNFIASTALDSKQLQDGKAIAKMGVSSSVMDYTPFNVFALKHKGVPFYQSSVGPYDNWAIEYAYTDFTGESPRVEDARLKRIATRCNEPGLAFQTDENADSFDPAVVRFDLSKNPLDYYQKMLQVTRSLLLHLGEREPKHGESYYTFTRDFQGLLNQYVRAASLSARYIGGLNQNRNQKGDPREKPVLAPVAASDQKRALDMICTYILSDDAFKFPQSYYTKLTNNPNAGLDITALLSGNTGDYPIRDQFASIQRSALIRLMNPTVLRRVVNNEFKIGDSTKALTLPYLFHTVDAAVWSELSARKNIGTLHRQLQRGHADALIAMVTAANSTAPDDAKTLAWAELRRLKGRIAAALAARGEKPLDEYTTAHLAEVATRIGRALDARLMVGSAPAVAAQSPLQSLLGGEGAR